MAEVLSSFEQYWWLIPAGFVLGAYGTLIGAGGGFVLVPLLLLLYPKEPPEIIVSISLAVVFLNAAAGSVAYGRKKRIDYKSGLLFSLASVPGAILGALTTAYIPRGLFDSVFGVLMILASIYLLIYPKAASQLGVIGPGGLAMKNSLSYTTRELVDGEGHAYKFNYNPAIGVGVSFLVGYVSSLLGVGGGFIHVPVLVNVLNFPVHIATATSHFILAVMAFTGTLVHVVTGAFTHGVRRTIALGIGVIIGAPFGAALSGRIHGDWIIRALAAALAFVGIRILFGAILQS
jgi:uncharacterized membrane protein YfcA